MNAEDIREATFFGTGEYALSIGNDINDFNTGSTAVKYTLWNH
jgi:hypothetical protein